MTDRPTNWSICCSLVFFPLMPFFYTLSLSFPTTTPLHISPPSHPLSHLWHTNTYMHTTLYQQRFFMTGSDFSDLHAMVESVPMLPQCLGGDIPDDVCVSGWIQSETERDRHISWTSRHNHHLEQVARWWWNTFLIQLYSFIFLYLL